MRGRDFAARRGLGRLFMAKNDGRPGRTKDGVQKMAIREVVVCGLRTSLRICTVQRGTRLCSVVMVGWLTCSAPKIQMCKRPLHSANPMRSVSEKSFGTCKTTSRR